MLKKIGFVATAMAAGAFLAGGVAAADTPDGYEHHHGAYDSDGQLGLLNLNNTDALHNVNVLGVQVPVRDVANGIGVPVLSPGEHEASGESPYNCAASAITDGGTSQGN